jgi:hypothetical protein
MKKLLILLTASIFLAGCTPKDLFVKPPAGLDIATNPAATVFLNDTNKGNTPYSDKNLKAGTYTVKLVPDPSSGFAPYETKLTLTSKASTVISHNFAASDTDASGYTLELQEDPSGQTFLSVISNPDTVSVMLDNKPNGFTPLSKLATTPGSHSLVVTSPGYIQQELSVNAVKGYNLIVNFKLAGATITLAPTTPATDSANLSVLPSPTPKGSAKPTPSKAPIATSSATIVDKPYVLVGDTGTGWLRVRRDASGTSSELGKATTGEKLPYLGETTDSGWFKIQFEGNPGWVSGKYVTLVK